MLSNRVAFAIPAAFTSRFKRSPAYGPFRVVFAVLLRIGVQVRASAGEIRTITFADIVNVNAVYAGRQLRSIDFNVYAFFCGENPGRPDFLALTVDDIRVRRFRCSLAKRSRRTKQCRNEDEVLVVHSNLPGTKWKLDDCIKSKL